jgi:DNA-binding CsgD family transcriptional regulator
MRKVLLTQTRSNEVQASDVAVDDDDKPAYNNVDLISSLYDVADAPEGWARFLGIILQSMPGSVAAVATHSHSRQRERLWGFQAINIRLPSLTDIRTVAPASGTLDPERANGIFSPTVINRLSALTPPHCLEVAIDQPCLIHDYDVRHAVLGLCDKDADAFSYILIGLLPSQTWTHESQATLEGLLPHIAKIIRLRSLIEKISAKATTADFVLNRLPIGVVTFTTTSAFPTLNLIADQLVRSTPDLLPHLQKLAMSKFNPCRRSERQPASAQFVTLPEPLNELFHFVVMAEVPTSQPGTAALTFFVVSANRHIPIDIGTLQRLFQLTYAEARIAGLIVNGHHIDEIAEALTISLNTVRTHLRHIFEKTNVERQADLIHLLLRASIAINSSM